jgi:hypothetical protein
MSNLTMMAQEMSLPLRHILSEFKSAGIRASEARSEYERLLNNVFFIKKECD